MYETILIPYDGSNEASRGAEHGVDLAATLGASIHALYVIDLPDAPRTVYYTDDDDELIEDYEAYGEEVTGEVCEMAGAAGVECTTALRYGRPSTEIVDYAEDEGIDAIVIGSAYQGTFRALLGSTTDRVVRAATVPVITTRIPIKE